MKGISGNGTDQHKSVNYHVLYGLPCVAADRFSAFIYST